MVEFTSNSPESLILNSSNNFTTYFTCIVSPFDFAYFIKPAKITSYLSRLILFIAKSQKVSIKSIISRANAIIIYGIKRF